jgi:hypothetical protein
MPLDLQRTSQGWLLRKPQPGARRFIEQVSPRNDYLRERGGQPFGFAPFHFDLNAEMPLDISSGLCPGSFFKDSSANCDSAASRAFDLTGPYGVSQAAQQTS